jgi:hypothetical protein
MIPRENLIKAARLVGDHARENIEPAARAFEIGGGGDRSMRRRAA